MSFIQELDIKPTEYIDFIYFDNSTSSLEITFNLGPDSWESSHKLIFTNVSKFTTEVIDDEDQIGINNFTDLVIEFSEYLGDYYLHLTTAAFSFNSNVKPTCKYV